jgi:hypothetical protein
MYKPINVKEEYRDKLKLYSVQKKKSIITLAHEWIDSLQLQEQSSDQTHTEQIIT